MARLTNNLINRPNLINFVRQFCAPFQLMIRVHATWHVSSSPRARSRPRFPVSSLRANQFLPNENWLSGIRGTSPSFDASIEWPSFFPPVRILDFFFFFDFDTGNRVWKPSRIFIIDLPSMKLLTLNFIIEDNFFLERSILVFCYYCLCKIELFLRLEVSIIRVCIIRVINKSSVRCVILCYLCFAIHTSFCHLPLWW